MRERNPPLFFFTGRERMKERRGTVGLEMGFSAKLSDNDIFL